MHYGATPHNIASTISIARISRRGNLACKSAGRGGGGFGEYGELSEYDEFSEHGNLGIEKLCQFVPL
jgi:hypothetical protein